MIDFRDKIRETWSNKTTEELAYIIDKRCSTMQERYGCDYSVQMSSFNVKLRGNGSKSKPNELFAKLLDSNGILYTREYPLEGRVWYDFKVGNILLEIDPTVTHNATWSPFGNHIDKNYHKEKSELAIKYGFRCIHIWDWDDVNKVVKLLLPREKLFGRKCIVKEIDNRTANTFLDMYHLQGSIKSNICIGLFSNDELVSVMTFGKPRYSKHCDYELLRYASSCDVIGGAEKLFSYFIRTYDPNSIVSYCDYSKFSGKVYETLGFEFKSISLGKHWFNIKTSRHITQNMLNKHGFDRLLGDVYGTFGKGSSNEQLMYDHGFLDVYDAGQATYVLRLK